jgi:hypothetical protein
VDDRSAIVTGGRRSWVPILAGEYSIAERSSTIGWTYELAAAGPTIA